MTNLGQRSGSTRAASASIPWAGFTANSVSDTGIGLPENSRELVFERFRQLDPTITRRFRYRTRAGHRQGLVTMHGGEWVWTTSLGSTFWFTVPAYRPRLTRTL